MVMDERNTLSSVPSHMLFLSRPISFQFSIPSPNRGLVDGCLGGRDPAKVVPRKMESRHSHSRLSATHAATYCSLPGLRDKTMGSYNFFISLPFLMFT